MCPRRHRAGILHELVRWLVSFVLGCVFWAGWMFALPGLTKDTNDDDDDILARRWRMGQGRFVKENKELGITVISLQVMSDV